MTDPSSYRPARGSIPTDPGVYRFSDPDGRVVYVGKAKNLRQRLSSYFQDLAGLHPRTQRMVTTASSVQWTVVSSDVEALTLEYTWIKEFEPRFNVKFRDDKSYPFLVVTMGEKVPRALITRRERSKSDRSFGPYAHVWAIRETLDLLLRVFPIRTCSPGVYRRAERSGRPCLLGFIDKCSAPCIGRVSEERHRQLADGFVDFMDGNTGKWVADLKSRMANAAAEMDYESAARFRDDIQALDTVMSKNSVVLSEATDADLVALAFDDLEVSVQVFHVRGGRIRGQRGWVAELLDDSTPGDIMERALAALYEGTDTRAPQEILVSHQPTDPDAIRDLTGRRTTSIRIPVRGEKKDLLETVTANAVEALRLGKLKRSGDLTSRSKALEDLGEALEMQDAPLRIECFDISHSQGTNVVGSMVVFEDGLPRKSEYRRFSVTGDAARDDTASMHDVMTRRLKHHLKVKEQRASGELPTDPETGEKARFAYPPQLIVVDGGQPQVAAAQRAFDELGITDIALVGIAKRLEELWLPDEDYPLILPRTSEALFLIQRLRDEAHRFAISYHRSKRGRSVQESALDAVPGLGPARKRALLEHFVTVDRIRKAGEDELAQVKGIGRTLAQTIMATLAADQPGPAVNMTTGEILE
ncbi:excinuclease ABC subunit UvrC [Helcobacillus massiliensis]|uniref:excinuclease ABC subunit UvrC n=1 Tax=Helcobacillus massiliensis TaxID=521392 RepID=UPI0025579CAA|nr:excinuclease ABC subunit UvrC [Helcobacillus massiliensis]MDK7741067.1 excinuclease ABC subunit UvrC [Helcobacillus massiliensis]WOO93879.1 excinuclease ABC subunit UvrC [Helcobacillus massiliensis]